MNHRRKISMKGGLFVRIVILVSLLITFIVSVNTFLSIRSKTGIVMKGLIEKNKLFALLLSTSTKSAFRSADWYSVENLVKKSVESEEVIYCRVVKPDGEIFLADDRSLYGKKVDDTHLLDTEELLVRDAILPQTGEKVKLIINPVEIGGDRWSVSLALSLRPINRVKMSILYRNLVEGILIILLGGFITFFLSRSITKPIAQLVEGTKEVSSGNLEYQIYIAAYDEIGKLANAFNQMTRELKKSRDELEAYSKTLEERVEERTKELQHEINERKGAEVKLKQAMAELEHSNAELQQFAYVASHDLQEPLRMVASYTQLLARRYRGKLDSDADEFIFYAVDGATRMKALINGLLSYSRVGTKGKDFEPTDCEAVFKRTLNNLQKAIEESGAKVTHDPLPRVMADDMQLGQLFQNLIGNAIKFRSEEPPSIHVSCERIKESAIRNPQSAMNKGWVFSVHDNGIGIDPEFTGRIFIIFQRLHKRGEYPGTGIGLAICKKIVERHGGRIWVESDSGKGSTFYFTIPLRGENSHG